jgi:mannose-6-phosphate isomerase-like protein (cupin superfamily)
VVAVELEGGCRVFGLREGEPVTHGGLAVRRHVGRDRGAQAVSLSVLELAPGARASWLNGDCDEVLFVLSGHAEARLDNEHFRIAALSGVFARPGASLALENTGPEPLMLLDSRCPDPGPEISPAAENPIFVARSASGFPSAVVRFEDQPTERAGDGRSFRVLVDAKAGCEQVTQFVGFVPPGRAPEHYHEYEEVICILEGEGRFWSGASSAPVRAGSCLYLPRRQPHCLENTGAGSLELYGLFYPAGSPAVRYNPGGISPRR